MSDSFTGLDKACYDDKSAVRRALVSEVAADDTYAEIIRLSSNEEVKKVMEEIQADEQNHVGRLLGLLTKLEGGRYVRLCPTGDSRYRGKRAFIIPPKPHLS